MVSASDGHEGRPGWFVGARFWGPSGGDQTPRFLEEGIWQNGYTDRYIELVRSIQPGDRIAIKSTFTRKGGLPFDNRGYSVSLMQIKATGTVKENMGDGRYLKVEWERVEPPRDWYFFTYRKTVWRVSPGSWFADSLIKFTFDGEDQDINSFRNVPYWKERFGDRDDPIDPVDPDESNGTPVDPGYTVDDIVDDGCFLNQSKLEMILSRLTLKKSIILQGPPGTGKTWLAKKLAFALIGQQSDRRVRRLQFHPNLSYEDFIRGYRPDGDGRLTLVDGPFLEVANMARRDPSSDYVIVIEEINRGNPAQIFGEMLTLLEADKRDPSESLMLAYPRSSDERVHIPPNLYVIGTMNVADRSIAMVDLALRRRFAFIDLEPTFGESWRAWVNEQCTIPTGFLTDIEQRMTSLNEQIAADRTLGLQFRIGHSYVTPPEDTPISEPAEWFRQVVETEIGPLLDEYWFDDTQKAESAKSALLAGL